MDAKAREQKHDEEQDAYIVSTYLPTNYLLVTKRETVTLQKRLQIP